MYTRSIIRNELKTYRKILDISENIESHIPELSII